MKKPPHDGDDKDYEVGYGKPPKHTRFKPGQSGNPAGRPKGSGRKSLRSDIEDELRERIWVREGDRSYRVSKGRAMVKALVARAMKGDPKAVALLNSMQRPDPRDLSTDLDEASIEHDEAAIQAALDELDRAAERENGPRKT